MEKELSVLAIKLTEREVEERLIRFQEDDYYIQKEEYEAKIAKKMNYLKQKGEYNPNRVLESEEMKDLLSFIKTWFYWKQGQYRVTFEIESSEDFDLKDDIYEFSLNPLNIELLESNKEFIPLSYEDSLKWNIQEYQAHKPNWNWVNPLLKKLP